MRILITGATGFIGFHLAQRLAAAGHEIVGAARQADTWRTRLPAWEWRKRSINPVREGGVLQDAEPGKQFHGSSAS